MTYYILNNEGQAEQVPDLTTWAKWYEASKDLRRVDRTNVTDDVEVSTVFLAVDHNHWGGGQPILFETMIFGGEYDQHQWRYSTKVQAQAGHDQIVAALLAGTDPDAAVQS